MTAEATKNGNALAPGQLMIVGRVEEAYQYPSNGGNRYGHVVLSIISDPNDKYNTQRATYLLTSSRQISSPGDEIKVKAMLSGSVFKNKKTNPETGHVDTFRNFNAYLREVE